MDINQKGYTLLEICVVLSILSTLYLIATPLVKNSLDRQQTQSFLQQLSSDLNLASNQARTKRIYSEINILTYQRLYLLKLGGKQKKVVYLPPKHQIKSNFSGDKLYFYADGQISQAGTITITDPVGGTHQLIIQLSSGRFWIKHG